jgi:hypothetical protein
MYYRVDESVDEKIIGCPWPQVRDTIYPINIDDPRFIKFYFFRPLDKETVAGVPLIKSKARLTDLLSAHNNGTSFRLTISDRLKRIFEDYHSNKIEFFPITIKHKNIFKTGYWLTNILSTDNKECVDYALSEINETFSQPLKNQQVFFNSHEEFMISVRDQNTPGNYTLITKPVIKKGITKDILVLEYVKGGGIIYCVSEKLKAEIEAAGCTGLVFHPIEQAV